MAISTADYQAHAGSNAPPLPDAVVNSTDPNAVDNFVVGLIQGCTNVENAQNETRDRSDRQNRYDWEVDANGEFEAKVKLPVDVGNIKAAG